MINMAQFYLALKVDYTIWAEEVPLKSKIHAMNIVVSL